MSDLSRIESMIHHGTQRAQQLGVAVSIAVVDRSGHLVGFHRMEGASFMTVDIAIGKAWTAAAFRAPSAAIEKNMAEMPAFASSVAVSMGGKFMPRQGGVIDADAGFAVGVSGASALQDEEVATFALTDG